MTSDTSLVFIGKITRPHGIRGEVCAQYYAESYDYFKKNQVFLKAGKLPPKPCTVKNFKEQGNLLILKIEGINSRTDAELYRNYDLVIEESVLTDSDLDAMNAGMQDEDAKQEGYAPYLHHIVGSTAFVGSNDIGTIDEIAFPAGQEIWFIRKDGQEILFPAVSEFIERYDLGNKAVYLCPPEGLLEIYLSDTSSDINE